MRQHREGRQIAVRVARADGLAALPSSRRRAGGSLAVADPRPHRTPTGADTPGSRGSLPTLGRSRGSSQHLAPRQFREGWDATPGVCRGGL